MSPYIVGFGVACIDYIVIAPAAKPGGYSPVRDFTIQGGGLTGTAMVACARLGARAKILGRIGDDGVGDQVVEGLEAENVDTSDLIRVPGGQSLFSIIMVDADTAERTIYCRADVGTDCSPDAIALDAIKDADVVVLDAHWSEGARVVVTRARQLGIPTVCDINVSPRNQGIVALCDYPVVPRASAMGMVDDGDMHKALDRIRALGPKAAVVTCGEDGAYYADDGDRGYVEAFKVDAVDTTGAGDVFHGAFAVGLARGWQIRDIVTFTSAVSAIKCTKVGGRAGIPTFPQTIDFLASRGIRLPGTES